MERDPLSAEDQAALLAGKRERVRTEHERPVGEPEPPIDEIIRLGREVLLKRATPLTPQRERTLPDSAYRRFHEDRGPDGPEGSQR